MNEFLTNQESNKLTPRAKLLGLPRPLAGALLGILSALLVGSLFWAVGLVSFAAGLLYPGLLLLLIVESRFRVPLLEVFIIFGVSIIPPAIIGALLSSKNTTRVISGTILLVLHGLLWVLSSFFFTFMD